MQITEPMTEVLGARDGAAERVLFHTYDWAFQRPGGGEVQLLQTRRHLEELGVTVDLFDRWHTQLQDYRLVHSFSLLPQLFWEPVKLAGCVLTVSSIHWPWAGHGTLSEKLRKVVVGAGKRLLRVDDEHRRLRHEFVDLFFPNSQMEADLMAQVYGIAPDRFHVVPNGVEERFAEATPQAFEREYGLRDFVLCVGRVDGRKNQLTLIRALKELDTPIVIIGEPVLGQEGYVEECRREAGPNVHFLGKIEHASPLLASAYAAAGCLVLPSYIETPGLCALEAGLAGTPLVVTEQGCTREYFGDEAVYVSPDEPEQIRASVVKTLADRPDTSRLRDRIRSRFLWKHAAEATRIGYAKAAARAGVRL